MNFKLTEDRRVYARRIIVLLLALMLTSCVKELNLPVRFEPRMNVACVLVPGREVRVQLTSNYPVLDSVRFTPITTAQVELYRGTALAGLLTHSEKGIYTLSTPIAEGETYTLKASCNGYPSIESTTTVPNSQTFSISWFNTETIEIGIPPANTPSYYATLYFNITKWSDYEREYVSYDIKNSDNPDKRIEFTDQSFDNYNFNYLRDFTQLTATQDLTVYSPSSMDETFGSKFTHYLSNDLFLGHPYTLKFPAWLNSNPFTVGIYLNIYQLSPELYKTFMGIAAQNEARRKRMVSPVSPYNAIRGGTGFFGATLVHTIDLVENPAAGR